MRHQAMLRSPLMFAVVGALLALTFAGCGGGGGGSSAVPFGRSYQFASGTQAFGMSVDAVGRYTVFIKDSAVVPNGSGGQGNLSGDGKFFSQSDDFALQFSGTVSSDGSTANVTVRQGSNVVGVIAAPVLASTRTTPTGLVGTYYGTSGLDGAFLTADSSGNACLWARIGGAQEGALLTVSATGALESADGSIVGQIAQTANGATFTLTKFNGAAINDTLNLTRATRAKWTFMVFLNGSNNLQAFGPLNFNQMEEVGSTADVNIVVQWKQANCATCGNPAWTGTHRYLVTRYPHSDPQNEASQSPIVQDLGQSINMGDWHELRNFITWSQQRYPADHYALVVWDHGAGWRPTRAAAAGRAPTVRSVSIDDQMNSEIQTWELPQAMAVTPALDMVIFDASLMQMTEVAYEIRNSATYVVGSEESPPGAGYVYNYFLTNLISNPSMTPLSLGTSIVNDTLASPPTGYGLGGDNTQSLVDLSKMQAVADSLSAFGNSLNTHRNDTPTLFQNARNQADSYAYPDNKDLWDYAAIVKAGATASDLQTAATNVQNAIQTAVLVEAHGSQHSHSHGLAIYVPSSLDFSSLSTAYNSLALGRTTSWSTWLQNQP